MHVLIKLALTFVAAGFFANLACFPLIRFRAGKYWPRGMMVVTALCVTGAACAAVRLLIWVWSQ